MLEQWKKNASKAKKRKKKKRRGGEAVIEAEYTYQGRRDPSLSQRRTRKP